MNLLFVPPRKVDIAPLHFTARVLRLVNIVDIFDAVKRHKKVDWGLVSLSDAERNKIALAYGGRLTSAYQDRKGVRFWITTEADRSKTTVLLPRDNRDNNNPGFLFPNLAHGILRRFSH